MRSIWSGSISFGLVNIPVKLLSAVESGGINFDMLSKKDMAPIRYARIDTKTGKEVPWKDIVKGYEYTKGKYVVVDEKDFEKASPEKSKAIDISQFVKEEEIDPILYEKPYYIIPGKGAEKTYNLLIKALEETKSVGIAEFMLRNRVHVCAGGCGDDDTRLRRLHARLLHAAQRTHRHSHDRPGQGNLRRPRQHVRRRLRYARQPGLNAFRSAARQFLSIAIVEYIVCH